MSPILVLLHGMLGGPTSFSALRAALPATRRTHAPTLFGHGFDLRAVPTDLDGAADRLAAELGAALGEGPIDLLGYSFGARLALVLCARHPRLVRRAVFVSGHPGLADDAARAARRAEDEALATIAEREGLAALVDAWEARPIFADQAPAVRAAQRAQRAAHDPQAIGATLRQLGLGRMPDHAATLAGLGPRACLVVGARDAKFRALADQAIAATPTIVHHVLPDCGHNPLVDAPAALAARVEAFLSPRRAPRGAAPMKEPQP